MQGRKKESQVRGHAVPEDFYLRLHDAEDQETRRRESTLRELSLALVDVAILGSRLSALQGLVHVVQVSSCVQEDVLALCHGCAEVLAASTSVQAVLSGRASANERREVRERQR